MRNLFFCLSFLISFALHGQTGQKVLIELGEPILEVGQAYAIKITVKNTSKSNVASFPELEGLRKEGRSVSHANIDVNGKSVLQHIIIQNYRAENWGEFDLPSFKFIINGEEHALPTGQIEVLNPENPEGAVLNEENEDAQLFLFINKKDVYVGEGFRIHLAFYVSKENTASWEFPENLSYQVDLLANKLKPENSLESKRNITNIQPEPATIQGKKYIRYKLYEGVYYPLTEGSITLPSVSLNMDKVVRGKDSTTSVEIKTFSSKQFTLNVQALPDHPLKNRVSVGDFKLTERSKFPELKTGKIINYALQIKGKGNVETILFEKPKNDNDFDFYPPETFEKQATGSEMGEKQFTFKVFPKDSGQFKLGDYFSWIYFNTRLEKYDTLRAKQLLNVTGETIESSSSEIGGIYEDIESLSISEKSINYRNIVKNTAKVLFFLMLAGMIFIFDFRRKKEQ